MVTLMADNILLSILALVIINIYQHDPNIPFDRMANNAQNQPPWPSGTEPFQQAGCTCQVCKIVAPERKFPSPPIWVFRRNWI
jgi:hypothetical protein